MAINVISANIITFLAHMLDIVSGYMLNEKQKIMALCVVSSLMSFVSMVLLGSKAGMISVTVTIIRLVVIMVKDAKQRQLFPVYLIFLGLYGMTFFDKDIATAACMVASNICSLTPKWFSKDMQKIRVGALFAQFPIIVASIRIENYSAIPFYVINIVTISISLFKWYMTEKRELPRT